MHEGFGTDRTGDGNQRIHADRAIQQLTAIGLLLEHKRYSTESPWDHGAGVLPSGTSRAGKRGFWILVRDHAERAPLSGLWDPRLRAVAKSRPEAPWRVSQRGGEDPCRRSQQETQERLRPLKLHGRRPFRPGMGEIGPVAADYSRWDENEPAICADPQHVESGIADRRFLKAIY
jgi:hypothetical protein